MRSILTFLASLLLAPAAVFCADTPATAERDADTSTLRVFIFAGPSSMVWCDFKSEGHQKLPTSC